MFPYTDTYAPALFCCDGVMILLIYVFMNSFSGVVLGYIYTIQARLSCLVECENLSDMWLSSLEIGGTQFRSVIKIAPKSPCLWCKQKSYPVWFSRRRKSYSVQCEPNLILLSSMRLDHIANVCDTIIQA